jgi:putative ABC transport system permease protein
MLNLKDFSTAFYSLSKAKGYVFTIVLTLGITLGALVAMFNLNYQLLAAPLPYPNAERLFMIQSELFDNGVVMSDRHVSYPSLVETYQRVDELFEHKAIITYTDSVERRMPDSPVLTTISTTPEFLTMLQAPMELGRRFTSDEGLNTMVPVVIISHRTWQKLFQLDPNVLGKTLNIMEVDFKIIGVVADSFIEPELDTRGWKTDVFLPFDYDDMPVKFRKNWSTSPNRTFVVGLLKRGVDKVKAEHEISSYAAARFKDEVTSNNGLANASMALKLVSFESVILGTASQQSLWMLAGVLVLLLIASTNIVNLILARAANQQRALAIQVALGAQQKHIFKLIFTEILLLVIAASCLSIAIAFASLELLKVIAEGQLPRLNELHINPPTLLFAMVLMFVMALLFTMIVSRQINYRALNTLLQTSGKGVGLQISAKVRQLLILSQVALTGVLLAASLQILLQSIRQLTQSVGYNTTNQYQVLISVATLWGSTTPEERLAYFDGIESELRQNSKVEAVGLGSHGPVSYMGYSMQALQADYGSQKKISADRTSCNGSFLNVLGIPLVTGRYYTDAEVRNGENLMLVNETLARQLQVDGTVLDKVVYQSSDKDSPPIRIIGVVKDLHLPGEVEQPRYFISRKAEHPEILIHVKPHQKFTPAEINAIAAKFNSQLKVFYMRTTERSLAQLTAPQKTAAGLTAALALLALGLTAIGIYGVLSYSVQLRRFELGIRMAIGARPITVFLQILKDNLVPVVVGLMVALVVMLGLWLWVQHSSYSLQTSMWGWLLPVVLILSLTAVTSLLSVWGIIRKPASDVLRGD